MLSTKMLARHNDGLLPHMPPNFLCFRHSFCAEEETLHQKENSSIAEMYINPCYVELMWPHGYAALPYEASTDRPTCWTPAPLDCVTALGVLSVCTHSENLKWQHVGKSRLFAFLQVIIILRRRWKTREHTGRSSSTLTFFSFWVDTLQHYQHGAQYATLPPNKGLQMPTVVYLTC